MNVISFKNLNSTNTYGKQNIENLQDRTIISADFQSNGYGRFERSWVNLGVENIYMSFILKPSDKLSDVHANLTQYLSICLCQQLEEMGLVPKIKWPNDVLLNDKKICGILAESVVKGGKLKGIVLGIGVNLNTSPENLKAIDRPASSLNIEWGQTVNKQIFMQKLIERFFLSYDDFLEKNFKFIKAEYEKRLSFEKSERLRIAIFNLIKEGVFQGVDNNGNLLLLLSDGKIEKINMGEII